MTDVARVVGEVTDVTVWSTTSTRPVAFSPPRGAMRLLVPCGRCLPCLPCPVRRGTAAPVLYLPGNGPRGSARCHAESSTTADRVTRVPVAPKGPNGRTDGRTDEREDGRTNGRTDGRTEERTEGRKDERIGGRKDERTNGRTEGRRDDRTLGRTDGRRNERTND